MPDNKLILQSQAQGDLVSLFALSAKKLSLIRDFIYRKSTFNLVAEDYWELSDTLGIRNEDAVCYIGVLGYIYQQAQHFDLKKDEIEKALLSYGKGSKSKKGKSTKTIAKKAKILANILSYARLRREAKILQLQQGVIKHAIAFRSFCDYRPLFKFGNRDEIDSLIPVVIARIRVRDDLKKQEDFVFQLDEETAKDFVEFAKDIEKKLKTMKKYDGRKIKITT